MLRATIVVVLAALASAAPSCDRPESAPPAVGGGSGGGGGEQARRVPLVPKDHALYDRFEGTGVKNDCAADSGCVRGGCSAEICSAASDIMGTCEALPVQIPASASCGCVAGQCQWWSDGSATLPAVAPREQEPDPKPGAACGDKTCADGEQCIEYYGVAGPRGPKFQSCGIPCKSGKCAGGRKCVTIADGPGPVCQ